MSRPRNGPARIFAIPVALGVATVAGLGAGLVGDGGWDLAAALGLAAPVAALVVGVARRR